MNNIVPTTITTQPDQGPSRSSSQQYQGEGSLTWPLRDLDEQTWITGTHSELQQRILFLLPLAQRCEQAEQEKEQVQKLHTESYIQYARLIDWIKNILMNATITSGCKITYIFLFFSFFSLRHQIVEEELPVSLTTIAEGTGQSTSTVSDHLVKAEAYDLLSRREEKEQISAEEYRTHLHFTLHQPILDPQHIDLQKEHGGGRQKGCKKDGTPMDKYTVQHCPTHGEIEISRQPGLRKEANKLDMVDDLIRKYEDRVPHALKGRKHDAFGSSEPQAPIAIDQQTQGTHHTHSSVAEGQRNNTSAKQKHDANVPVIQQSNQEGQKQDAFEQRATSSLSLSPEKALPSSLTEGQSTFWTQWCSISGTSYESLNETAQKHVCWLAEKALTTTEVQSLYDCTYDRLRAFSQATGKALIPPRLGNLVKAYPEWSQTRIQKEREQVEEQKHHEHVSGTGHMRNWTQERLEGKTTQHVVYQPLPSRAKGTSQGNTLDFSGTLEQLRMKRGAR